jgi:hypothetical protein
METESYHVVRFTHERFSTRLTWDVLSTHDDLRSAQDAHSAIVYPDRGDALRFLIPDYLEYGIVSTPKP